MMIVRRWFDRFARVGAPVCFAVVLAGALATAAVARAADAKEADKEEEPKTHEYTIPYFITGVALTMAVLPLCWPALRRWDLPLHDED